MSALVFHGKSLKFILDEENVEHVPVKWLCELFGLDPRGQRYRMQNAAWAGGMKKKNIPLRGNDGKNRALQCVPLRRVGMFFATLHASSVPETMRAEFIAWQDGIADAIDDFLQSGVAVSPVRRVTPDLLRDMVAKSEGDAVRHGSWSQSVEELACLARAAIDLAVGEAKEAAHYRGVAAFIAGSGSTSHTAVGSLYVAASHDGATIKVGHTKHSRVQTRIDQLRSPGGSPWKLLGTGAGSRAQEKALHRTLKRWLAFGAEYYRNTPELMAHLRQYAGGMLQLTIGAQS